MSFDYTRVLFILMFFITLSTFFLVTFLLFLGLRVPQPVAMEPQPLPVVIAPTPTATPIATESAEIDEEVVRPVKEIVPVTQEEVEE